MSPPTVEAPEISLRGLSRIYQVGDTVVKALDGLDLDVARGEFLALTGASGSGKSTCLNILGCLDAPDQGSYRLRGVEIGKLAPADRALIRRYHLGFVFQSFQLLARTSAVENVELPLIYRGVAAASRRELALEALAAVGLADRADHTPSELSGGQQQRVAIARAIVGQPTVLLADEPTGNLDSTRKHEILDLMVKMHHERGLTIVLVTHEADIAERTGRVVRFADGKLVDDQLNAGGAH